MSKGFWKDYFSFSKRERTAVSVLILIIVIFIFLPGFFAPKFHDPVVDDQLQRQLDSITALAGNDSLNVHLAFAAEKSNPGQIAADPVLKPFSFDPNTLPAEGFKRMGLKEKIIQTILNYRNKGGIFRQADDIRKVYGLRKEEADQLIPFIIIEKQHTAAKTENPASKPPQQIPGQYKKIDINSATVEEWKTLPGIGEVLSNRIVKFRNTIHGFKSVDDVRKTYGLSDSTYRAILPYIVLGANSAENE